MRSISVREASAGWSMALASAPVLRLGGGHVAKWIGVRVVGRGVDCRLPPIPRAQEVDGAIGADAVQPGSESRAAIEAPNLAPGAEESFLHHVVRVCFVSRHTIGEPEHSCRVALHEHPKGVAVPALRLLKSGLVEIEALCFIRGRSIARRFFILDEAQQLTPHEVKTVITRISEGSKIILIGDPAQIDNPYVDSRSNGLVYCHNRMKGQSLAAHVTLTKGERSRLAELAADLL